jgi:hypothetical protein
MDGCIGACGPHYLLTYSPDGGAVYVCACASCYVLLTYSPSTEQQPTECSYWLAVLCVLLYTTYNHKEQPTEWYALPTGCEYVLVLVLMHYLSTHTPTEVHQRSASC